MSASFVLQLTARSGICDKRECHRESGGRDCQLRDLHEWSHRVSIVTWDCFCQ